MLKKYTVSVSKTKIKVQSNQGLKRFSCLFKNELQFFLSDPRRQLDIINGHEVTEDFYTILREVIGMMPPKDDAVYCAISEAQKLEEGIITVI